MSQMGNQGQLDQKAAGGVGRMQNLELLRCVAMMMVVVLHFLSKGDILGSLSDASMDATRVCAWFLEAFSIVAVNVYMMISGYFLSQSSFKLSRLLKLYLQVWTYSVGFGVLGAGLHLVPTEDVTTHYFIQLLFPISMEHYWFMTAYLYFYLLLPFLSVAVKQMSKKQMQITTGSLLLLFCVLKSVLPVRLDLDRKGYDCIWYICVFMVAAYIRKYGMPFCKKVGKGFLLYGVSGLLIFAGTMALRIVYLKTGSLGLLTGVCMEYNHILVLLGATGLFMAFLCMKGKGAVFAFCGKIAPYTLGVYLLHENLGLRYAWQPIFGANHVQSVVGLLGSTILAAVCVFAVGIIVEWIRSLVMTGLGKALGAIKPVKKVFTWIENVDHAFEGK